MIISIDGNIGSGKSTLVENLLKIVEKRGLSDTIAVYGDCWTEEGRIKVLSTDVNKTAFRLGISSLLSFSNLFTTDKYPKKKLNIIKCNPETEIQVFSKKALDERTINDYEYDLIKNIKEILISWSLDIVILVDTPPIECFRRIQNRSDEEFSNDFLEQIKQIDRYYKYYIHYIQYILRKRVYILDGMKSKEELVAETLDILCADVEYPLSFCQNKYNLDKYENATIILNGGSFSPPTCGHIQLADITANDIFTQTRRPVIVYFVPVTSNYGKTSVKSDYIGGNSDKIRVDMLNMCVRYLNYLNKDKPIRFFVSTHEIDNTEIKTTYDSLMKLKTLINNGSRNKRLINKFKVLLGIDNVRDVLNGKWEKGYNLIEHIICIPREGYQALSVDDVNLGKLQEDKQSILKKITMMNARIPSSISTASSTHLRSILKIYYQKQILNNYPKYMIQQLESLTLSEIINYILSNNYYKKGLIG